MAEFCDCGTGQSNLGVLSCPRVMSTIKKHIRVPLTDSTGVRNSILLTDFVDGVLPDSYILGKLFETDVSKRWFITPAQYENVEPSRTDSTFEDFSSGARSKVDTGVKEFLGILPEIDGIIATKMNTGACSAFGHFEVGKDGAIKGEESVDGSELFPIEVANGSFEAVEIDAVEGQSVQRIQISFQYSKTVNEGKLKIIQSSAIGTDLLNINGIIDGTLTGLAAPAITTTTFSSTFFATDFGYYGQNVALDGQVNPADWLLLDAALSPVAISLVGNTTEGQYDFTFTLTESQDVTLKFVGVPATSTDQGFESNTITVTLP